MLVNPQMSQRIRGGYFPQYNLRGGLGEINYGSTPVFAVGMGLLMLAGLGMMYFAARR